MYDNFKCNKTFGLCGLYKKIFQRWKIDVFLPHFNIAFIFVQTEILYSTNTIHVLSSLRYKNHMQIRGL